MKKKPFILLLLLILAAGWIRIDNQLHKPRPVNFPIPIGWPKPVYDFSKNPLTEEGIALGKKLFYDERLSKDGTISCGSCHQQFGAFATYDHPLSHGNDNSLTTRNAPGLFNLAWQKEFMWDGGINHLDLQPLAPITALNEMAETLPSIIHQLQSDKTYRQLCKAAFGDEIMNTRRLGMALSQFVLQLVSSNSKYDRVMRGEANFILPEQLGYAIFQKKCESCHKEPLFTDFTYRNVDITLDPFLKDVGRMRITGDPKDSLKFKVPSLRNVAMTFPYGHDGRFFSLQSVMEHYRNIRSNLPQTDSLLRNGLPLSNFEIGQLKAFLYTLTDSSFLNDARFAAPGMENNGKAPVDIHQ